jgi:peroxiredoxin
MNLTEELNAFATQMSANAPEEVLQTMGAEIGALATSGLVESALKTGDKAPDFTLTDSDGNSVSLSSLLFNGPAIISFNRGNWCPFCNLEFKALQEILPAIADKGANLVVIAPQLPEKSAELKSQNGFDYPILYDKGNEVARKFGIVFALPESLRPIHEAFGMDIPGHNGDDSFELPFAATYVINTDGEIIYSYINANWMERAEPADYLAKLDIVSEHVG